jgi:DNA-directed RNA polymerase subunit M/transcription elongation factor TFIIS
MSMPMRLAPDSFILVYDDDTVANGLRALESVEAAGYKRPRYLVVQTRGGQFAGIVPSVDIEWADPDEVISQQRAVAVARCQVDIDASEDEKAAAVQSSEGLALAVVAGRPVAVLRPMRLAFDDNLTGLWDSQGLPSIPGTTRCPHCGREFSSYHTVRLRRADGQLEYRRMCPVCHGLISAREM